MARDIRAVTAAEMALLLKYAAVHGRTWKDALRDDWYAARLTGPLHALRNDPRFGPAGLIAFRFPK